MASVNRLVVPAGHAAAPAADVRQRDEQLLRAAAGLADLHDGRHDDHAAPAGATGPARTAGLSAQFSGDGFSDMRFDAVALPPGQFDAVARAACAPGPAALDAAGYAALARPGVAAAPSTLRPRGAGPVPAHRSTRSARAACARRADGHGGATDMFGKLTWDAIPLHEPIPLVAAGVVVLVLAGLLVLVTVKGWWPMLWRDWITSVDHKRIGVMYVLLALVMLVRGFVDALMMRSQLALAAGHAHGVPAAASTTTRSSRPTARS